MDTTRRSVLSSGLALVATSASAGDAAAGLARQSEATNSALMRGDLETYLAGTTFSTDFTLFSPFGGEPTRGRDLSPARLQALGRFFRNGTLSQEVVQTYATADMVVLAVFERAYVEVGGLPAQPWALRVTLVYRREGRNWELVHRHADPLVHGIELAVAARLAAAATTSREPA